MNPLESLPVTLIRIMKWRCIACREELQTSGDGPVPSYIVACTCGRHYRIEWYHQARLQTVQPIEEKVKA